MKWWLVLACLVFAAAPAPAAKPNAEEALNASQGKLGASLPDLRFTTSSGESLTMSDLRGKPVILSLIYTGCTTACPAIIENLYPAVQLAQQTLGRDRFTTLTVGFDSKYDTPDRMRSFARTRGVELPNWKFLSGNRRTINALSKAIGFEIIPSAGGFDHMAQITIADAEGKIYRHIYGGAFSSQAIVEPLMDIVYGRNSPVTSLERLVERVKLFCTVYNPNSGRYYFNYSIFISIVIGLTCLMLVFAWLVREFRRSGPPPGRGV